MQGKCWFQWFYLSICVDIELDSGRPGEGKLGRLQLAISSVWEGILKVPTTEFSKNLLSSSQILVWLGYQKITEAGSWQLQGTFSQLGWSMAAKIRLEINLYCLSSLLIGWRGISPLSGDWPKTLFPLAWICCLLKYLKHMSAGIEVSSFLPLLFLYLVCSVNFYSDLMIQHQAWKRRWEMNTLWLAQMRENIQW